ncbi:ankyrin repeat domain-containing protein [Wolbachia pipientis]|uniref:ankyrin repeat domain-containing protein n=1 Tax=Wolbachia pipientis TaxID=955 RepID=UPI00164C5A01
MCNVYECSIIKTDINISDNNRYTILHWAARNNNVEVVTAVLKKGACVNVRNYGF